MLHEGAAPWLKIAMPAHEEASADFVHGGELFCRAANTHAERRVVRRTGGVFVVVRPSQIGDRFLMPPGRNVSSAGTWFAPMLARVAVSAPTPPRWMRTVFTRVFCGVSPHS